MQLVVKKHECIPVWKASVKFDILILFLKFWNVKLSDFSVQAEVSLNLSSTRLFLLLFLRHWILIQIPIDREILRLFQFCVSASQKERVGETLLLWVFTWISSTDTSFTESTSPFITVREMSVFLFLALEFEVASDLCRIGRSRFF